MKRASLLLAAVLLLALVATVGAGGARAASASRRGGTFPNKSFILAAGQGLAEARPGLVTEQLSVIGVSVMPESERELGPVGPLVVDASDSMQGAPIAAAMSAARAFLAQRAPGQQIAFVTFNAKTNVVLPLTKTRATIAAAIDHAPSLAYGTHMYDSVSSVIGLLSAANLDSASIVLLSDGADTGSGASLQRFPPPPLGSTVGLHQPGSPEACSAGAGSNGVYAEGGRSSPGSITASGRSSRASISSATSRPAGRSSR
jgi:hypothetical protein